MPLFTQNRFREETNNCIRKTGLIGLYFKFILD